jgi:hypothetical protein
MKHSNDTIGNRSRDLSACSTVPQPTAPSRALLYGAETQNKTTNSSTPPLPRDDSTAYKWGGPLNEAAAGYLETLERYTEGNQHRNGFEVGTPQL